MIVEFSPKQWHHIAFQTEEKQTTLIVNELVRVLPQGIIVAPDITHARHPQDFTIGGFGEEIEFWNGNFWVILRDILMRSASQGLRVTISSNGVYTAQKVQERRKNSCVVAF